MLFNFKLCLLSAFIQSRSVVACAENSYNPLIWGTLTKGTNHDLVLRRYLDFHSATSVSTIHYYDSIYDTVSALKNGTIDFMMMNAVHPQASSIIGRNYRDVYIVDAYISPSMPLVVATRRDVQDPQSIAILYPSVANYTDTSKWSKVEKITTGGLVQIGEALISGTYDSAIIYEHTAISNNDTLRIDEELGSPDDCWLVLSRNRTYVNSVQAWPNSPVTWLWRKQWYSL